MGAPLLAWRQGRTASPGRVAALRSRRRQERAFPPVSAAGHTVMFMPISCRKILCFLNFLDSFSCLNIGFKTYVAKIFPGGSHDIIKNK